VLGAAARGAAAGGGNGAPADGPPGGSVGNFIVGAAEGFGGRLIRTVSFLGWTFEASGGLGGTGAPGKLGMLSAINLFQFKVKLGAISVKLLFVKKCLAIFAP
jgi:hypothetical protein